MKRNRMGIPVFSAGDKPAQQWYSIQNAAKDDEPATVYLFDEIDPYWGVSAEEFVKDLGAIDASAITVKINSPGGSVYDGIAIMNALKDHPATITTSIEGLAASAASFIAMAGDEIVIRPNAEMMIHNAHGIVIGGADDMREMADQIDRLSANIATVYAERAGGEVTDWQAAMNAETWYSADEAVEAGLADRVEKPGKSVDEPTAKARFDLSIFNHAGRRAAPAPRRIGRAQTPSAAEAGAKRKGAAMATLKEAIVERLGLSADADDDAALDALNAALDKNQAPAEPTPEQAAALANKLGFELVAKDQRAQEIAAVAQVRQLVEERRIDNRNSLLDKHLRRGAIAPSQRADIEAMYDASPEVAGRFLAALPDAHSVPLNELGHAGQPDIDASGTELADVFAKITGRSATKEN